MSKIQNGADSRAMSADIPPPPPPPPSEYYRDGSSRPMASPDEYVGMVKRLRRFFASL